MSNHITKTAALGFIIGVGSEALAAPEYKKKINKITSNYKPTLTSKKKRKMFGDRSKIQQYSTNSRQLF